MTKGSGFFIDQTGAVRNARTGQLTPEALLEAWREGLKDIVAYNQYETHGDEANERGRELFRNEASVSAIARRLLALEQKEIGQ